MIEIDSKKQGFGIKFPTRINDFSVDNFNTICNSVKLPPHYCIVALCLNSKLFDFVAAVNSTKDTDVSVIPILAMISDSDSKEINACVGDRIIIDRTTIERGVHINLPTVLNSKTAQRFFANDNELTRKIISKSNFVIGKHLGTNEPVYGSDSPNIIVLEFKIVPCNDISAAVIRNNNAVNDSFFVELIEEQS